MYNSTHPESVPNLGKCLGMNVLQSHFQRNQVEVELQYGDKVKTGHIVADGTRFDWREAYSKDIDWQYLYIRQLSYTDEDGKVQVVDIGPKHPHEIVKADFVTQTASVTKVNGKRWGVMIKFNWATGDCQIITDQGSPIVGCLLQLIE